MQHRFTRAATRIAFAFVAATVSIPGAACAQSEGEVYSRIEQLHGNAEAFSGPFQNLTDAMRDGDAETVADLAEYPLEIHANGETYDILSAQDFIDNFDTLITEETRNAVADQSYDALFVNSDGVMFANGEVWMGAICDDDDCAITHWAITAINN
ncbi:hypothetical protein QO002_002932 [Pararhizobium capsulatum DSM 1112]|uniref:DUF4440 domain-containing protein n=1 Tax=Pararhizobium capsulatum DSM 1112 TaxID=1121113 RepID=A0ABU0BRD0_9HYPH|nr:hypothetical protein [Pararhizobium capsulatum]MDQ0320794.1 hypothetical protein [Pararhizobium capsulatum DSM 1112]